MRLPEHFFAELRRRNVIPTVLPYLGLMWLLIQIVDTVVPILNLSALVTTVVTVILFAGLPVVVYLSWFFNFTLHGWEHRR